MRLTIATRKAMEYACLKFHYAKAIPVTKFGYNVYNGKDEWCGVIIYGRGANSVLGNQYGLAQGECLELVRVALNGKQECTSQAVAMSLKALKKDCPLCRLIVSYADADQEHLGTIYQATNWIFTGLTNVGGRSFVINGKKTHQRTITSIKNSVGSLEWVQKHLDPHASIVTTLGKRKYLMPLDKKMRKQILPLAQPYPKKDENWQKIDRNIFKNKEK